MPYFLFFFFYNNHEAVICSYLQAFTVQMISQECVIVMIIRMYAHIKGGIQSALCFTMCVDSPQ